MRAIECERITELSDEFMAAKRDAHNYQAALDFIKERGLLDDFIRWACRPPAAPNAKVTG